MSICVADCLKLASLREAKLVAGAGGVNKIVASVSVLEYADVSSLAENLSIGNELVITAFISVKDNVKAQCSAIRRLNEIGEVGLILYYIGIFIPSLDKRVIETANELNFPLICMPEGRFDLRYSEVICDVMEAIIKNRMNETYYVNEMLERISLLQPHQRTMDAVLRMISDRIHCSLLLTDRAFNLVNSSMWPMSASLDIQKVLSRCKEKPGLMHAGQTVEMLLKEEPAIVKCRPVHFKNGNNMNLIVLGAAGTAADETANQAAEVIRLFINIWKNNRENEGSAELIFAIMNDEPVKMRRLAEILHVDVAAIHIVWIIKSKDESLTEREQETRNTRLLIMTRNFLKLHSRMAVVDVFEGNVVAFMDNPVHTDQIVPLAESFMEELNDANIQVLLSLCTDLENTTEVREAYVLYEEHLNSARIIYPSKHIITIREIQFARRCWEILKSGEEKAARALLPLRPVYSGDKLHDREMIETLTVFMLDAQNNIEETARRLFVHKNTVKYRIRKINERLGYRAGKFPEAFVLYTALAVKRLMKGLE